MDQTEGCLSDTKPPTHKCSCRPGSWNSCRHHVSDCGTDHPNLHFFFSIWMVLLNALLVVILLGLNMMFVLLFFRMLLQLAVLLEQNQELGISIYSEQNSSGHWDKQELHFSTVNKPCVWDVVNIKKNNDGCLPSAWLGFRSNILFFWYTLLFYRFFVFSNISFYSYYIYCFNCASY